MIPVQTLISIISVCAAVIFGYIAMQRNNRTDIEASTEEKVSMNIIFNSKLDNISSSVEEIKKDNKELKKNVEDLNRRVLLLEYDGGLIHDRRKDNRRSGDGQ